MCYMSDIICYTYIHTFIFYVIEFEHLLMKNIYLLINSRVDIFEIKIVFDDIYIYIYYRTSNKHL